MGKRIIKSKEEIPAKWLIKSKDTKYEKWYNSIIKRATLRGEEELGDSYETHHIIPICIGGTNDKSNLVKLTYKEHALAHKLLCEIYPHCPGIAYAVIAMMLPKKGGRLGIKYFSSREIAHYKTLISKARKGKKLSEETKQKMSRVRKGVPHPMSEKGLESLRKALRSREVSEETRKKISENAKRLGIKIIEPILLDARKIGEKYFEKADRVLVDAPCSGLGVIRRKSDLRLKKNSADIEKLPELQFEILNNAAKSLKIGGILIYSTCTILKRENEEIAEKFLSENKNFELIEMKNFLPHIDNTDGFFYAKFIKR